MGLLDITYRCVRLGQCITHQAGRQQYRAPVEVQRGGRNIQPPVAGGRLINVGKRRWKVACPEGDDPAVFHRINRFELLASFGVQVPGGDKISIRAAGRADGRIHQPPGAQRTSRPHLITYALKDADRAAQVVKRRGIPAEGPQRQAAPMQHLPLQYPAGQLQCMVECGQPGCRPACVSKG